MSTWKSRFMIIVAVGVIAAGVYQVMKPAVIPVDMETISKGILEITADEEGVTRIKEIYTVSAPIAGVMLRSPREVGDSVTKETSLVATIKPTDPAFLDKRTRAAAQAAVNAAQAAVKLSEVQIKRAVAELDYATTDYTRAKQLSRRQTIAQKQLEQAELRMKTGKALLEAARAELEVRKQELVRAKAHLIEPRDKSSSRSGPCCVEVLAPVSGRVLKILTESETVVASGTSIMEIGDPADLEIKVDLLSEDAVRIKEGAAVVIENWGGEQKLKGRVRRIEPSGFMKVSALGIEEQRVKAQIDINSPYKEWERLGHDYRVFVRITVWKKDGALKVPLSSLFRLRNEWVVFRAENGVARLTPVKIGQRNNHYAEVLEGLKEENKVIVHPGNRLADGVLIVERAKLK